MDDFYMVLPSNVSTQGDKNLTSHFRTELPKALELDTSQWRVALHELSYPHSWTSMVSLNRLSYTVVHLKKGKEIVREVAQPTPIKDDRYSSLELFLKSLNDLVPSKRLVKFYVTDEGYVGLECHYVNEGVILPDHIKNLLGFTVNMLGYAGKYDENVGDSKVNLAEKIRYTVAKNKPDLQIGMYNIFIYSNLVEETLVGNQMVKLLRTIPVSIEDRGRYLSKSFQNLRYLKLSSGFFQHIDVMITDEIGELVKFKWGKVVATLHFKKINKQTA